MLFCRFSKTYALRLGLNHFSSISSKLKPRTQLYSKKSLFYTSLVRHCEEKKENETKYSKIQEKINEINDESQDVDSSAQKPTPRKFRLIHLRRIAAISFLLIFVCVMYMAVKRFRESNRMARAFLGISHLNIGGPFDMIDFDGKAFSEEDIQNKITLLYFGFTHCPDICPETLELLTAVLNRFSKTYLDKNLNCIFVSLDPKRDTPAALKDYLKDYHPHIKGLTGTTEQIDHICATFKAYGKITVQNSEDDYIIDHSTCVYVLNGKGYTIGYFFRELGEEETYERIKNTVQIKLYDEELNARINGRS